MHCRMFTSIPGPYVLHVSNHPFSYDNWKCLQTLPDIPWGTKSACWAPLVWNLTLMGSVAWRPAASASSGTCWEFRFSDPPPLPQACWVRIPINRALGWLLYTFTFWKHQRIRWIYMNTGNGEMPLFSKMWLKCGHFDDAFKGKGRGSASLAFGSVLVTRWLCHPLVSVLQLIENKQCERTAVAKQGAFTL